MESPIDERYRLLLLEHYLDNAKQDMLYGTTQRWQFICPFCGYRASKENKRKHRKGALLWNSKQNSWVFTCAKKGSVDCMYGKTFGNLISALNPALGQAYKRDRWYSGTTGKGHNCGPPQGLVGVSTGPWQTKYKYNATKRDAGANAEGP